MSVIGEIASGIDKGWEEYRKIISGSRGGMLSDIAPSDVSGELALEDNAVYMRKLLESGYAGKFALIYTDPPFFTKSKFNAAVQVLSSDGSRHRIRHLAFDDRFERSLECYIENMTYRLLLMKDLLSEEGTIWIHLDWHSSHYVKAVLDEIMGVKNFVNEIVWCYKSGGSGKRHFSRKHDTILVYSKGSRYYLNVPEEKSYNRGFRPYSFKGVTEYCDDTGWYTLVNMKDVWNIDMVGRTSAERTGYATQKPLELMKRIIEAGSREGDLAGDFFCGSGSLPEAAELTGRKWRACDNERLAVSMSRKRLSRLGSEFSFIRPAETDEDGFGRADITVFSSDELENGKTLVKLGITDFVPDIDTGYIQMNDREYVEEGKKKDPLQFIDYVMIRADNEGADCVPVFIYNNFRDMSIITESTAEGMQIVISDVFGKEYRTSIQGLRNYELGKSY